MLTPVKQNSATDAHKWFKEYMAIANTAGKLSLLLSARVSNLLRKLKKVFLWRECGIENNMHRCNFLLDFRHRHVGQWPFARLRAQ